MGNKKPPCGGTEQNSIGLWYTVSTFSSYGNKANLIAIIKKAKQGAIFCILSRLFLVISIFGVKMRIDKSLNSYYNYSTNTDYRKGLLMR